MSGIRPATHAGSWYTDSPKELSTQLQGLLQTTNIPSTVSGARVIVSPHAGYRYCGNTMAYSYASLDLNPKVTKNVFILGPSHHVYFKNYALLSRYAQLETPLGNLKVGQEVCESLCKIAGGKLFKYMEPETDMSEHSLEMQLPMLVQALKWRKVPLNQINVIPIMISHSTASTDEQLGNALTSYIADASNVFIISSDFCHWGRRFAFTGYVGDKQELTDAIEEETEIEMLTARSKVSHHAIPIWQSIELLDRYAMGILQSSEPDKYNSWKKYLEISGNTICGAQPIGVILSALQSQELDTTTHFEWPHYSQSSQIQDVNDSSVSYASGYAVV